MAVRRDTPQVTALRKAVENRFGHKVESRSDFSCLCSEIEQATREHIAENTLRRLWGRLKSYETIYTRTLDVLSQYLGHEHWDAFCQNLKRKDNLQSEITKGDVSIRVEDLNPGDRIRIGWLPDRICVIEFQGGRIFKAIDCKNSTLQNGDSFECSVFLKNYPLFVDNLFHGGELCLRYSMGLDNGLTILEKIL